MCLARSRQSDPLNPYSVQLVICSAGKDHNSGQAEPITMGLDDCLEYCADDELVEVISQHYRDLQIAIYKDSIIMLSEPC